jgi:MFS family permease
VSDNSNPALRWYLTSTACYLIPGGIQQVLFPFLVAVVLHESAERVGIAQMSWQLPALFLLLVGGVIGDRFDQRRILLVTHLLAGLPPLLLAFLVAGDHLSFYLLVSYGLIGGVFTGLSQPARDALLNRVAGGRVQRTVIIVMTTHATLQMVGIGIASLADYFGVVPLMVLQGLTFMAGAFAVVRVKVPPVTHEVSRQSALEAIREGIGVVLDSPVIRPAVTLMAAIGVFFAGGYVVLLPLIVRDVYGGSAVDISLAFAANMLGTIVASLWLLRRGGVRRPGRAIFIALTGGCVALTVAQLELSLWGFYTVVFFWGLGGGVCLNMLRGIVQAASRPVHRARVMSVFSLGMMGGMPIGSLLMGYTAASIGALNALLLPVVGVLLAVIYVHATTGFAKLRTEDLEGGHGN